jgi:hypothetical protein
VRQQLSNLLNGVPLSIWYDWKNDGDDPKENEHNFGTMTPDLRPKPAYNALKVMTHELAGYHPLPSANTSGAGPDFNCLFTNDSGRHKTVVWTTGEPHALTLQVPGSAHKKTVQGLKGTGEPVSLPVTSTNTVIVPLEPLPAYLDL